MKEVDPIKNEGARVFTTLNITFSNTQWQLSPQSVVGSARVSNPYELLYTRFMVTCQTEEDLI